jgi:hypothetical protein
MYWPFARSERFSELADQLHRSAHELRLRMFDAPRNGSERAALLRRISLLEDRRDRFRTLARVLRSEARRVAGPDFQAKLDALDTSRS